MKTEKRDMLQSDGKTEINIEVEFLVCPACNNDIFLMFRIKGQDHWHLMCVLCGAAYCPEGACKDEK